MADDLFGRMNMGDKYRLSPSTGVPKSRSAPPPIGGARVEPPAGGGYEMGPAPSRRPPSRPIAGPPRPPAAPKYGGGDDLLAAYRQLTSGFPAEAPVPTYAPPPGLSAGRADTFMKPMQAAAADAVANQAAQHPVAQAVLGAEDRDRKSVV